MALDISRTRKEYMSLSEAREAALARFNEMGLPEKHHEYWRYSNPKALLAPQGVLGAFHPIFNKIDGHHIASCHDILIETAALKVSDINHDNSELQALYGTLEADAHSHYPRPLAAQNSALAQEGLAIHCKAKAEQPLIISYGEDTSRYIHHIIKIDDDAELTLIEEGAVPLGAVVSFEIFIGKNAKFSHIRNQGRDALRASANYIFATLEENAELRSFTLSSKGRMTRNESFITLQGDHAKAFISGASIGQAAEHHHDDTIFITHDALQGESRQVFKKMLRNGATGVFQGKILVKAGAQKTDGYQISQGLLLDENSQFLAKPELEIYADDVACSHGSTVGAIDEEALFYLTSRGIPKKQAIDFLVLAFLGEAIDEIEHEQYKDIVMSTLENWLAE